MRAKNHDQRKGQWLVNKTRTHPEFYRISERETRKVYDDQALLEDKALIEQLLFNMENDMFDEMMGDYNK